MPDPADRLQHGSAGLRRLQWAMAAAGLSAFAMLYATQASLPDIGRDFGVGATAASLTVSLTTGVLALTVLPVSAFAERVGRTRLMTIGLGVACLSLLAGAAAPDLWLLLAARALDGLSLAAVVAVAMGHIGDEVAPAAAPRAVGVYVSATSIGGLVSRLVPAGVDTFGGWRVAMVALAAVGAVCTVGFARLVPRGAPARDRPAAPRHRLAHLREPGVLRLCLTAFLLMGGFVGTYNYLTFRLGGAPFDLPSSVVGLVFLAYLAGTITSTAAASAVARAGRRTVVLASTGVALAGLLLTLPDSLPCVLVGLVVFTTGFFGAHAVASGWVGARVATGKSQASALYVMGYYLGSSVGGTLIGFAWTGGGWPATVAVVGGCYLLAAAVVSRIRPVSGIPSSDPGQPASAGARTSATTA